MARRYGRRALTDDLAQPAQQFGFVRLRRRAVVSAPPNKCPGHGCLSPRWKDHKRLECDSRERAKRSLFPGGHPMRVGFQTDRAPAGRANDILDKESSDGGSGSSCPVERSGSYRNVSWQEILIPAPLVLVTLGLLLGFVPGLRQIGLPTDLVRHCGPWIPLLGVSLG